MNSAERGQFRSLILAQLEGLAEADSRGQAGQDVVKLDQQAVGRLSRMDALQNQAMAKAGQARRTAEETRLLRALERIEGGSYGRCEDCDEDIAKGRLKLDPAALLCISCASG